MSVSHGYVFFGEMSKEDTEDTRFLVLSRRYEFMLCIVPGGMIWWVVWRKRAVGSGVS